MFNRIKKPQKNSKKDNLHKDNPTFWQNSNFFAKRWNFLNQPIESGTIVFHTCYKYFAIFVFIDGGEPYFATINYNKPMICRDNNPHMFRLAMEEESEIFRQEMKEKGFEFKNNRLYHNGRIINYNTPDSEFSMYGKHRLKYKRNKKERQFYSSREY